MQTHNAGNAARLEDQLADAVRRIDPQYRRLVLDIALQMGERHPYAPPVGPPVLRLVQG